MSSLPKGKDRLTYRGEEAIVDGRPPDPPGIGSAKERVQYATVHAERRSIGVCGRRQKQVRDDAMAIR
jgi:hypothetical protein